MVRKEKHASPYEGTENKFAAPLEISSGYIKSVVVHGTYEFNAQ